MWHGWIDVWNSAFVFSQLKNHISISLYEYDTLSLFALDLNHVIVTLLLNAPVAQCNEEMLKIEWDVLFVYIPGIIWVDLIDGWRFNCRRLVTIIVYYQTQNNLLLYFE